jgi:hypothetical protein
MKEDIDSADADSDDHEEGYRRLLEVDEPLNISS